MQNQDIDNAYFWSILAFYFETNVRYTLETPLRRYGYMPTYSLQSRLNPATGTKHYWMQINEDR